MLQISAFKRSVIVIGATLLSTQLFAKPIRKNDTTSVPGWPDYLAMGAIGGPNTQPNVGDDNFNGRPVDAVFKYAGNNGNGDPGVIDPPMNVIRMTNDLDAVSKNNQHPMRVIMVEYTGQMSGGENFSDFTNSATPNPNQQDATYIMARHFASLIADAQALQDNPIVYNNTKYYGGMIMNPDLLGAMQQNNYIDQVNNTLKSNDVNRAVDIALSLMTQSRTYQNLDPSTDSPWEHPNPYKAQWTGTPYEILKKMLQDNYPAWKISSSNDQFWGIGINNEGAAMEKWFLAAVKDPQYDHNAYHHPQFASNFNGWVQANNWLIRQFAPKNSGVTFGWQENMWSAGSGWWLHKSMTGSEIQQAYSDPVSQWISTNAPSVVANNANDTAHSPDFIVFDRYEMDDSAAPTQATLYNADSWDNLLTAVGQVSTALNQSPVMLWQIPGSHLPYQGEANPETLPNAPEYVFSTAPVYFFGDDQLKSDLSNLINNPNGANINQQVGAYAMPANYNDVGATYQQYLRHYQGKDSNFDWSKDNKRLQLAAQNHVFAILWGGGNTTNVIKNFSNTDDHGWLATKIKDYYKNPVLLSQH